MRRKFSTLLDEDLYDRARLEARRQGKQIADVVGEALTEYLDERSALVGPAAVVAGSWGALRLSMERLRQVLEEEEGLLDG
jgi:ubiquinone biosynthesis protein UbiJ